MSRTTINNMKVAPSMSEKFRILFEFLDFINKDQAKKWRKRVKDMPKKDKNSLLELIETKGIHVFQHPTDNVNILDIEKAYDHIGYEPQRIKFPDKSYSLYPVVCATQYFMKMKQDPIEKFSARGRGTINPITQLPSRSQEAKHGSDIVSNTAVKFGKFETENLSIVKHTQAVALFLGVHSTSFAAIELMSELYYQNITEEKVIEITKAMSDSNKKNYEIICAWMTIIGAQIHMTYMEDVHWGTDKLPKWELLEE